MDWDKLYWNEFYDLVEKFENEEISYDELMDELNEYGERAVEAVGEDVYNHWLNIKPDYVALKRFNINENQIALF